jgi:hypothetical protein
MSDELTPIWRRRMTVLWTEVAGVKAELQWLRSRLEVVPMHQTPTSPASSLSPTATPTPTPSRSWPKRLFRLGLSKLTGEALSAAMVWLGTRFLTWALYAILGLPALAWLARWLRLFGFG